MKRSLATTLCLGFLLGGGDALGDHGDGYASALLGERLRYHRPTAYWTDMVSRPARPAEPAQRGPRSWNPQDQSPWANTYGTPSESPWRSAPFPTGGRDVVRMCSCYLPADARSWDGGPLTDADIARLCRAQCY